MADKAYRDMTNDELRAAMAEWGGRVEAAAGWPSAYFAAVQCLSIKREADRRGLPIANDWPITIGGSGAAGKPDRASGPLRGPAGAPAAREAKE
jgi:hypothetical protein